MLQFYPREVEERLAQLEVSYRGRQPGEIRVTRFQVVPIGQSLRFQGHRAGGVAVVDQLLMRLTGTSTAARRSRLRRVALTTQSRRRTHGHTRSPRRSGSRPVRRAGAQPPRPVRHQPALRDHPRGRGHQAGPRPDPMEVGPVQGRGLAGRRVRRDQRPPDDQRAASTWATRSAVGPCRLFLLRMDQEDVTGRTGRAAAVDEGRTAGDRGTAPAAMPRGSETAGDRRRGAAFAVCQSRATCPPAGRLGPRRSRQRRTCLDPRARCGLRRRRMRPHSDGSAGGKAAGGPGCRANGCPGTMWRRARSGSSHRPWSSACSACSSSWSAWASGSGRSSRATIAERTFNRAMQNFEDGDYRTAIRDFDTVHRRATRRSVASPRPG